MKKASQVVERGLKSVAHIVGILQRLRSEQAEKIQFVAHIKEKRLLDSGVGLVLYWVNEIKKHRPPDGRWFVYLSSRFADQLCPRQRGCKTVVRLLVESGILVPISPPLIGVIATGYQIPEEWIGVCPERLTEWQRIRLSKARAWKHALDCKEVPALTWIERSLLRITIPESEQLRKAMQNPRTEHSAMDAVRYLRDYTARENRKLTHIGYAGTFYTPIMSLPKTIVPTLLIDGEPVSQLDITSAHPSTLPRLLIEAEKKFKVLGGIEEAKKLAEELEAGRLYDSLAIALRIDPKAAKKRFLAALNGEDKHTYNDAAFLEFARRFPVAKQVIGMVRRGDGKRLNRKMAGILADVIKLTIETCSKLEIPVYPRTDEIVCRQQDEAMVQEILSAYFLDATSVHAKVGGHRVSFIPHLIEINRNDALIAPNGIMF
jgi:hypothetical protein